MLKANHGSACALAVLTGAIGAGMAGCSVNHSAPADVTSQDSQPAQPTGPHPDRSGQPRVGVASYYAGRFAAREMANGAPMDPAAANAASRTLPLGTIAKVTDISTGKSAIVTIEDRGP